jgi:phospholipid-translocating ATPase
MFNCSWTVITWTIVYGSTLLVMLWIALYSAFLTPNYVNEVVILFGSVQYWAAIVLSVIVAIGMFTFS